VTVAGLVAVGELLLCVIIAILLWPALLPSTWRDACADRLALSIAGLLELLAIAGIVHAGIRLINLT
jgi:hypothetical protein